MFSKTERLLAWRYLKSRKRTGFVSVIAGFSFLGIMLGCNLNHCDECDERL